MIFTTCSTRLWISSASQQATYRAQVAVQLDDEALETLKDEPQGLTLGR